ncbi:sensor histidine kinase [Geodermatophilus sp. CPCC 206100]|uniref:sensor histidine kinase n=1 Tax=Geodermatophilus sp. CPCC 206100 TaxID=3020054 RepID=UPI003B00E41B
MPTVARWWENRSAPQRIELYTRWSFYGWLAMTPLLGVGVYGSAERSPAQAAGTLFLAGSVAVAVTAVLLAHAGFAAHREGRGLPRRPALAAAVAAVATAGVAVLAFSADAPDTPALVWGVAMPPAMALTAASTVWPTAVLTRAGFGIGGATGIVAATVGPLAAAAVLAVVIGATVTFLAAAFRFSVWVLDVVREMERSRGVQLQLAVAEERLRFARDLHDVMGRNLSAIALKSQLAAELVRRGRDGAAEELADISRVAEESLREVRDVVRGYRRTDLAGELAGARSVLRAAGVTCTVEGEAAGEALPEPVQEALGWVVREAVTNVLRHSRATSCTVALAAVGGEAELRVTNDGLAGTPGRWGSGLTGLAERLAHAGGRLSARPEGDRFELTATVPARVPA